MEKHFVQFFSPGTLLAESSTVTIDSWDVEKAVSLVDDIKERYGATPYGFRFLTRTRNDDELDSKETASSAMYYLGGEIYTLAEVKEKMPTERILISNMECNGYKRIIINTNSRKWTQPLGDDDVVLDYTPKAN